MNYAITTQTYTSPQEFTIGDYTVTVDANKIVTDVDAIASTLSEGDSVYIVNMANSISNILTNLSNLNIYIYIDNSESEIKITDSQYQFNFKRLYIHEGISTFEIYNYNIEEFISPTLTSLKFNNNWKSLTILGSDLPKLQNLQTHTPEKIEITDSQDLKRVFVSKIRHLDLHGCPNVEFAGDFSTSEYINLNGCSSININKTTIQNSMTFVDLTDVNQINMLSAYSIDFTNEAFSDVLLAKNINSIILKDCVATNLDLKSLNCMDIVIINGTYDNISVLDKLDRLSISDISNKLSINSAKSINLHSCDVSCELISADNYNSTVISYYNKGVIGDVILSNSDDITLLIYECKSITLTNCTNIRMKESQSNSSFTRALNSISFTDCTFNSFSVDYSTKSIKLLNCSWIESDDNKRVFEIKNCDKTINEFSFFPLSKCDTVTLFNCPNFIFDDSNPETVYFINSNTTKLPNSTNLHIINCDLTYYNGQCGSLFISNCNNLQYLDLNNVSYGYIYCNKNLKYFTVDGKSYGTDNSVDDYVSKNLSKFLFRLNGFENVDYISNPNFVNGELRYDPSYIIPINQPSDFIMEKVLKNGIISINGDLVNQDELLNIAGIYGLYIITNNKSVIPNVPITNSMTSSLIESDINNIIDMISLIKLEIPIRIISNNETIRILEKRLVNNPDRSNIILMSTSNNNKLLSNLFYINLITN